MPRCTSLLALLLALPLAGCLSAETSEASQLSRLSHGIDESSTALDRFSAPAEAGAPKAPPPPPMILVPPPPERASTEPAPGEGTDDTQPRPTIRVWGTPGAHPKAAGGGSVTSIVYSDAGPSTPATPRK